MTDDPCGGRRPPEFDEAFRERLAELLIWRRDVRRFRTDAVDEADLAASLRAFELAPSVGNSQPWRVVSVESEDRRGMVRRNFERCNAAALAATDSTRAGLYARLKLAGLREAPVHLAIFADQETAQGHGLGTRTMPETLAYSAAGAATLFSLTARARGLGTGWVSILDPAALTADLDISEDWRFIAYLCVGYPMAEDDVPELEREGWQARTGDLRLFRR